MKAFYFYTFLLFLAYSKLIQNNLNINKENYKSSIIGLKNNLQLKNENLKKNLVIVVITNYDWDKIGIFFNSYVKANFEKH